MVSPSKRAKLASTLRWLAPSVAAASTGAVAGGLLDSRHASSALGAVAAVGFVVLVVLPVLLVASVAARGIRAGWGTAPLGLVDEDGSAPRLAAWTAVLWLSALALAWAMHQGTWTLSRHTAFKPVTVSFAHPVLAVAAGLLLVALSRPAARALTWYYRAADARWRAWFGRSLVTPRAIAIGTAIKLPVLGYVIWRLAVRPRLGPLDLSLLHVPVLAVGAALAVHAAWPYLRRARRIVGIALASAALAAIATSLVIWQLRPSLTLAIWGDSPIAGQAIDALFDLDEMRARVRLDELRPVAQPGARHPDVVLVTVDTLRADRTPPYGGPAQMPLLRQLAARGAVFEWAFAPSNVTRRSIPSMITGLLPNRVHGRVVGWALRLDPRHVVLAERLRAGGYETAGFVCCSSFWGTEVNTGLQRGLDTVVIEKDGKKLAALAREWLAAREAQPAAQRKPLFVWVHLLDPHDWQVGAGGLSDDDKRRRYDGTLAGVDTALTDLMAVFSQRAPEQAPIVIVTSDHGEALGDHGQPFHSTDLYNSQIRVPFIIAGPGIAAGRIVETVSLTDLTPTVLELAGFVPPQSAALDGRSLADLATGRRAGDPDRGVAFAAMIKDRSNPGGITAIVRGPWKLVESGSRYELYNIHHDTHEAHDVAAQHAELVDELRELLAQHKDRANASPF